MGLELWDLGCGVGVRDMSCAIGAVRLRGEGLGLRDRGFRVRAAGSE